MRLRLLCVLSVLLPAVAHASKCPDVLFVLDASDSMSNSPGGGVTQSKISIARQVIGEVLLGDPDAGVPAADPRIRFCYMYFPASNCTPSSTTPLPVPCDFNAEQSIVDTVNAQTLKNSTPTAEALEAAKGSTDMQDTSRPRFVVLVTDGMPTCGNDAGGRAVAAVDDLFAQDVTTFVVGFGTEAASAQRTLSGMAAAGQPPLPDGGAAAYYQANDGTSLAAALSDILGRAGGELGGSSCDPCADATCTSSEKCVLDGGAPTCVPDPCRALTCSSGQFCRPSGTTAACVDACSPACPAGQACIDGNCVTDGCNRGTCALCSGGQVAEIDGGCGPNTCANISCPVAEPACLYGSCSALFVADAGSGGASGSAGGSTGGKKGAVTSSGCGCTSVDAFGVFALVAGALAFGLRRKR